MAQADHVTIPIRASITGEIAKPSTSQTRLACAEFIALRHRPHPMRFYRGLADVDQAVAVLGALATDIIGTLQRAASGRVA